MTLDETVQLLPIVLDIILQSKELDTRMWTVMLNCSAKKKFV